MNVLNKQSEQHPGSHPEQHSGKSPQSGDWFVRSFGQLYSKLYSHRDDETAKQEIQSLMQTTGLPSGSRVIDICCGGGRHTQTLVEMGYDAWGVDLSPELLTEASKRAMLTGKLVRGDLRSLSFLPVFDAAVNLFTSFGYFQSDLENSNALRQMVNCIKPGGLIVIDHINRAHLEKTIIPHSHQQHDGMTIESTRQIKNNRVTKKTVIKQDDQVTELTESVRLYWPDEMTKLLCDTGVTDLRFIGDFTGSQLIEASPRMIVIGVKQ